MADDVSRLYAVVIRVPLWVRWWLCALCFVAHVMRMHPDERKVGAFLARHTRVRIVPIREVRAPP